jgi:RES domain-containing protein
VTPLPWVGGQAKAWRLDLEELAPTWDSGVGAARVGGRWNPTGFPVVYCSADPATAILEVAVHKGFNTLDTVRHVLSSALILDPADIHVVTPADVPPGWLRPGSPSRGQQAFGRELLERHAFVAIASAVSQESWNLLFNPDVAKGRYRLDTQQVFALDTRLNPPV